MDKKEAIYYLQYLRHDVLANSPYDVAIVTAINALSETKPLTNADRIRQMTDEELAEWLNGICNRCISDSGCTGCPIYDGCAADVDWQEKWLKQEVSEDAGSKTD